MGFAIAFRLPEWTPAPRAGSSVLMVSPAGDSSGRRIRGMTPGATPSVKPPRAARRNVERLLGRRWRPALRPTTRRPAGDSVAPSVGEAAKGCRSSPSRQDGIGINDYGGQAMSACMVDQEHVLYRTPQAEL